jgi:hypothetical protein
MSKMQDITLSDGFIKKIQVILQTDLNPFWKISGKETRFV